MLSYRVAQYNNDYQVERRQREWEEADEEERREAEERWQRRGGEPIASAGRRMQRATRRSSPTSSRPTASCDVCPLGPEMTKLSSWLGLIVCERCKERDLVQWCDYF